MVTWQGVMLAVDPCSRGWLGTSQSDDHCTARASWTSPFNIKAWLASWPLQVGGLAHTTPSAVYHGWREAPTPKPLDGCVSHLTLNGQVRSFPFVLLLVQNGSWGVGQTAPQLTVLQLHCSWWTWVSQRTVRAARRVAIHRKKPVLEVVATEDGVRAASTNHIVSVGRGGWVLAAPPRQPRTLWDHIPTWTWRCPSHWLQRQ